MRIGDRSELRPLREVDADELFRLTDTNRARLREWLPWVDRTRAVGDTLAFIRSGGEETWAICRDGRIAGTIGLSHDALNEAGRIGYWIGAEFEGQGLVTRAVRAVCDRAFAAGLHRIEIRCAPGNRRSRRIPERLGFSEEGRLREAEKLPDRYVDLVVYGVLASEWPHIVQK